MSADAEATARVAKKRKLEQAFGKLDESLERPRKDVAIDTANLTHRAGLTLRRSLYSTLSKYGIKSSKATPSVPTAGFKETPHLTAILSRLRPTHDRSASLPPLSSTSGDAEYRPSSLDALLSRLETYKLSTYANKPKEIDAVASSKHGWKNEGKDRLICGVCGASWVVVGRDGMGLDAANALVKKQKAGLVENHKSGCPWKTRWCDDSIYAVPLSSPTQTIKKVYSDAERLKTCLESIEIQTPLTSSQVHALNHKVTAFVGHLRDEASTQQAQNGVSESASSAPVLQAQTVPTEQTLLASVFGWTLAPPAAPPPPRSRVSSLNSISRSASRAPSVAPATPESISANGAQLGSSQTPEVGNTPSSPTNPSTPPRFARVASRSTLAEATPSRPALPRPSSSLEMRSRPSTPVRPSFRRPSSRGTGISSSKDPDTLYCPLCLRRIGLWAFRPSNTNGSTPVNGVNQPNEATMSSTPQPNGMVDGPLRPGNPRRLDLLQEHRSFCPYVVKSTVVPSMAFFAFPVSSHSRENSTSSIKSSQMELQKVEGYKAVLNVINRYNPSTFGAGLRLPASDRRLPENAENGQQGSEQMDIEDTVDSDRDGIKDMVEDVKAHGGKDLMRYIKGLLG